MCVPDCCALGMRVGGQVCEIDKRLTKSESFRCASARNSEKIFGDEQYCYLLSPVHKD